MSKSYKKKNGEIYYAQRPVIGADYNSFTSLEGIWGTDKNSVFAWGRKKRIKRTSFELLSAVFAKDDEHIYDTQGKH